jgi:signal transduction histidine kinase
MDLQRNSPYLKLGQFLDLESRWAGTADKTELAHRICRSAEILLETPAVAIGAMRADGAYGLLACQGEWPGGEQRLGVLAKRAIETSTPQLKTVGDASLGVFPFRVDALAGCLHVRIDRPLFQGSEVSFLRFLATLTAMVLGSGPHAGTLQPTATAGPEPASQEASRDPSAHTRARRHVAMAAHDLRNPLNVIVGYADLLDDGALGDLSDDQREAVTAIARQAATVLSVVDDLIDIDRLFARDDAPDVSEFDVRTLFDELRERCFRGRDGELDWPGPEAAFSFSTDRRKFSSIAQNLVDNALKHGGTSVRVHCTRRQDRLILEVSDDGPGMPEEVQRGLVAAAAGDQETLPSHGLGLYAIATWVRVLGANIRVADRDTGGTVVTVTVPAADKLDTTRERLRSN